MEPADTTPSSASMKLAEKTPSSVRQLLEAQPCGISYRLERLYRAHAPTVVLTPSGAVPCLPYPGLRPNDLLLEANDVLMLDATQPQLDEALQVSPIKLVVLRRYVESEQPEPEQSESDPEQLELEPEQSEPDSELTARLTRGEECMQRLQTASEKLADPIPRYEEENQRLLAEVVAAEERSRNLRQQLEVLQQLLETKNTALLGLEREASNGRAAAAEAGRQLIDAQHDVAQLQLQLQQAQSVPPTPAPRKTRSNAPSDSSRGPEPRLPRDFALLQRAAQPYECDSSPYSSDEDL